MKRYLDDGMTLDAAVADLEKQRAGKDLSKFAESLPKYDNAVKKRYKHALLSLDTSTQPAASPLPTPSAPTATPLALPDVTAQPVPLMDGATRYLAFDPSNSTGWAIMNVVADQVMSVSIGAIQVEGADAGARCNDLKRQIQPLLTPTPSHVFVESFHGHGRAVDAISFYLRAAIFMETSARDIAVTELAPQSWKSNIGVSGAEADKAVIKAKLQCTFGASFPSKLPNPSSGRQINFKTDASDAAGIALAGAKQAHTSLTLATPVVISAPSIGEKRLDANAGAKKAKH